MTPILPYAAGYARSTSSSPARASAGSRRRGSTVGAGRVSGLPVLGQLLLGVQFTSTLLDPALGFSLVVRPAVGLDRVLQVLPVPDRERPVGERFALVCELASLGGIEIGHLEPPSPRSRDELPGDGMRETSVRRAATRRAPRTR